MAATGAVTAGDSKVAVIAGELVDGFAERVPWSFPEARHFVKMPRHVPFEGGWRTSPLRRADLRGGGWLRREGLRWRAGDTVHGFEGTGGGGRGPTFALQCSPRWPARGHCADFIRGEESAPLGRAGCCCVCYHVTVPETYAGRDSAQPEVGRPSSKESSSQHWSVWTPTTSSEVVGRREGLKVQTTISRWSTGSGGCIFSHAWARSAPQEPSSSSGGGVWVGSLKRRRQTPLCSLAGNWILVGRRSHRAIGRRRSWCAPWQTRKRMLKR
jgi:hypothetical protein